MENHFLEEIIYEQNKELLLRVANKMFDSEENKILFIKKYHKKNYSRFIQDTKDRIKSQEKKIQRLLRLNTS